MGQSLRLPAKPIAGLVTSLVLLAPLATHGHPVTVEPVREEGVDSAHVRLESAVLNEINYVRTHPREYARRLGGDPAGREAAAYLEALPPEAPLAPTAGLAAAAAEHAADQGSRGGFDHVGADGSSAGERMRRHGVWSGIFAEEMSLGQTSAEGVVRQLIVDSGDPAGRHRRDLLDPLLRRAGVGCAPHKLDTMVCVIDIAAAPPPSS
ncbi:MAG TPA: CAP domain-containing protein [Caulobacteraceae bacterium]|nr:CAP domain-containing protein [Caulobacteraceae bacterium]